MPLLIRVRSKDGLFRVGVEPSDDGGTIIEQLKSHLPNADFDTLTLSNQPRGGPEMRAADLNGTSIADLGLKHGHLLYATYTDSASAAAATEATATAPAATTSASAVSSAGAAKKPWELAKEEPIDSYWFKQDGKIPRQRDAKFCRHGSSGMCDYCMPLEPYDGRYQAEHNIKHLSFHAHLRKLNAGANKAQQAGSSWIPPLDEADYSVQVPCPSGQHPSWPAGICTKCQPSAITLQRQSYRMVDHVEFSHPDLIEKLLQFWRSTAVQRFGFLLGRYEPYADVPMGMKVVVEAIHEPPQEGELDGVTIGVPWEHQARVEQLAKQCGLEFVGMIYSDLTADTHKDPDSDRVVSTGKVLCKRHKDSFFLSGCEVLFAASLQNANPTSCRWSSTGKYNSRFVTCVLTGNDAGEIAVEAYQVSEQAMAMCRSVDMIEASVNPNTIRIRPSSDGKRYVPEVFFRYKNQYGLDVKESAKPTFPVEYLIVNVTNGFPNSPAPRFLSSKFPIENRPGLSDQDASILFNDLVRILYGHRDLQPAGDAKGKGKAAQPPSELESVRKELASYLSDWHLLSFLESSGLVGEAELQAMCKVAVSHHDTDDGAAALEALLAMDGWKTLVAIANEKASSSSAGAGFGGASGDALDDELTPEEIAAIIASNESDAAAAAAQPTGGSRREPPSEAAAQAPRQAAPTSSLIGNSATALHPADSAEHRRAADDFIYTGDDDELIELDDDNQEEEEEDDEDAFHDVDDDEMQASLAASRTSGATPSAQVMDLTGDGDSVASGGGGDDGQVACPTCTVLNPAGAAECYLCGLPMNM